MISIESRHRRIRKLPVVVDLLAYDGGTYVGAFVRFCGRPEPADDRRAEAERGCCSAPPCGGYADQA